MAKEVAKPRSIKVTDTMWSAWQAAAQDEDVSVAALIIGRMEPRPVREANEEAVGRRLFDERNEARQELLEAGQVVGKLREEIADLKKRLAAKPAMHPGSPNERQVRQREPKKGSIASLPSIKGLPVYTGRGEAVTFNLKGHEKAKGKTK